MPLSGQIADVSQNILTFPQKVITVDLNGNYEGAGSTGAPGYFRLQDGASTLLATVAAYHANDNQNVSAGVGSVLTAGVNALTNVLGNADRQRNIAADGASAVGIATGAASFGQSFSTTSNAGTITGGAVSATLTPLTMLGILVGNVLTLTNTAGTLSEQVYITALPSGTTATVIPANGAPATPTFKNSYSGAYGISGFIFNIERDASGENSGASGKGTAVAAEYEYTSGGPTLANGTPSLLQYDREVAALGKIGSGVTPGAGYATSATTAGDALITPTVVANFKTLAAGMWIRLSGGANPEYVRVADTYVISATPATIPLTSPVVNTGQVLATWDTYGANGPGQNPVLWTGEGLEGVLLNDSTKPGFSRVLQGNTVGEAAMTVGGLLTSQVTPTGLSVIKATPGRLARVLLSTANGANAILIYDNASAASGTVIGAIPASATLGTIYDLQMPAAAGITIAATAAAGTLTVSFS